jgi:hypothetical protein
MRGGLQCGTALGDRGEARLLLVPEAIQYWFGVRTRYEERADGRAGVVSVALGARGVLSSQRTSTNRTLCTMCEQTLPAWLTAIADDILSFGFDTICCFPISRCLLLQSTISRPPSYVRWA